MQGGNEQGQEPQEKRTKGTVFSKRTSRNKTFDTVRRGVTNIITEKGERVPHTKAGRGDIGCHQALRKVTLGPSQKGSKKNLTTGKRNRDRKTVRKERTPV